MGTIRLSHQSKSYTCFTPKFSPKTFLRHSISTNSIAKDNHQQPPKMTNVMQNSAAQMGTESVMINKKEPVRQDTMDSGYASPPREMPVRRAAFPSVSTMATKSLRSPSVYTRPPTVRRLRTLSLLLLTPDTDTSTPLPAT